MKEQQRELKDKIDEINKLQEAYETGKIIGQNELLKDILGKILKIDLLHKFIITNKENEN